MTNGTNGNAGDALDFNDVPPAIDSRLSVAADVALRCAIEAAGMNRVTARRKVVAALEAACAVLGELSPIYAAALCAPLRAVAAELQELEAGRSAGDITRPHEAQNRRGDSLEIIKQQVRAVLAFQWLQALGVKPHEASKSVAAEVGVTFQKIKEWERYFKRDTAWRRRGVLAELWHEVETAEWGAGGGGIEDATAEHVMNWLRKSRE